MSEERTGRNSSIELFRILCLFLIFWMHGASSFSGGGINAWLAIAADSVGNIGVSCFILISGYFGVRWSGKKMIKLDLMLVFYCWIGLAFQLLWGTAGGGENILSYVFPVIGKRSWYFTCYFALAALSPFLNEAIEKLGRQRLKQLILVMLLVFSGVTTFFFFDLTGDGGKGIVQMVMLYLIGRYIRISGMVGRYRTGKLAAAFAAVAAVNFALNGALYVVTGTVQNRFARDNTLFIIAEAVLAFLIFADMRFENGFVNRIASYVPAIFIMEWTLRECTIHYLFDYLAWNESGVYHLILIGLAVSMIAAGSAIEALCRLLLHRPQEWLSGLLYQFWTGLLKCIGTKLPGV